MAERDGRPYSLTAALAGLGVCHLVKGNLNDAIPLLERGLTLVQSWNLMDWLEHFAWALGSAYLLSGRLAEGLTLLEEEAQRQAASNSGMISTYSLVLAQLGEGYLLAGRSAEALQCARLALDRSRERKERAYEARVLRVLGQVAAHEDPPEAEQAVRYLRQALALASELGMRPLVAHCHLDLARAYWRLGMRSQGEECLTSARSMYREMEMGFWLAQTEAALMEAG